MALVALPGEALRVTYEKFGARLLEANVRSFLSSTNKVNRGIRDTLRTSPEHFMAFNNGVVMIADEAGYEATADGGPGIAWLLGLHTDAWRAVVHDACSAMPCLLRPSQAIFLRWLATRSVPIIVCYDGPGPRDLSAALARAGKPIGLSDLAVALGYSAAAAARWARDATEPDEALRRICGALLGGGTTAGLVQRWRVWLDCARQEAALRSLGTDLSTICDWHVPWAPIVPRGRGRPPRAQSPWPSCLLVIETVTPATARRRTRR